MECSRSGCLTEKQLTQTMHRNKGNATAISLAALTSVTQFKSYCVKSEMREVLLTSQRGSLTGEHLTISWVQVLQFDLTVSNTCSFTAVLIGNGVESTWLAFFFFCYWSICSVLGCCAVGWLRASGCEGTSPHTPWLWGIGPTQLQMPWNSACSQIGIKPCSSNSLSLQLNRECALPSLFPQTYGDSIKTAIQSRRSMPSSLGIYQ